MLHAIRNIKIGMFIAFANLLIQGISFFVHNFIAKSLSVENFGYFGLLQTDYSIFTAIADFGMSTLILAFFAKRATEGSLFRNVLQVRLLCALMSAVLMATFAMTIRFNHPVFWGELILIPALIFQHSFFDWYFISGKFWKKLLFSKILHAVSYASIMALALFYFKFNSMEAIACAMVIAALPAFFFGVSQVFHCKILHFTKRTFRFLLLLLKAAVPYGIGSLASFAYLPVGLYCAGHFAPANFLGCYFYSHKLIMLASSLMVFFISSSLVNLHNQKNNSILLRDNFLFTAFISIFCIPLFLFPDFILKIVFFAVQWDISNLNISAYCLRILTISLILQALRMHLVSIMLKEKKTGIYGIFICIGGAFNISASLVAGAFLHYNFIPLATLVGDLVFTIMLYGYFFKLRRICW